MHKKIIYLPIETKAREFDSKCLIALACVSQGQAVVIGAAGRVKSEKPGVILLKSAAGFELQHIENLKSQGLRCAVIDEEGFVQTKNETQRSLRYSQSTLDAVDQIFFNGPAENALLHKFYNIKDGKGVVTGNPRFDFYKPAIRAYYQKAAERLVKKHGKYILITSRFGNVTPARKVGYLDFLKNTRRIDSEEQLDIFRSFFAHSKKIYAAFLELLPKLAQEFPDYTIVIRPHPSESPIGWQEAANGFKNIKIIAEGPIGPWVLGAAAVLHNGCTTGLEAYLMDRPVYSYMPYTSDEFDLQLPNTVSVQCLTEESLFARMHQGLEQNLEVADAHKTEFASNFLHNAGASYAYMNIALQLSLMTADMPDVELATLHQQPLKKFKHRLRKLMGITAAYLYTLGLPLPERISSYGYSIKKNPGFSVNEISQNMQLLAKLSGLNGQDLVIQKLDEDAFLMYKR